MMMPGLAFVCSAVLALYLTPLMREAALRFGIVDRPDGVLKNHEAPVAYLGGLAVFLSFLVTLALTFEFSHVVLGILLSGTLLLLVGLIDDLGVLSPLQKLSGQLLALVVLMKAGIFVKLLFIPWWLALAMSIVWLLAIINALNIIDVMDGLAAGVAAIAAAFLAVIAGWNDQPMVAVMSAALAGSLLGFLRFNFTPAKIYLGDSGSLFIGLMLGALAMNGGYTRYNWVAMFTPVIILGVPLFDLAFVVIARRWRGLSPFRGSPDHFALRLRRHGLSVRSTVISTYAAGVALGIAGIAVIHAPDTETAIQLVLALSLTAAAAAAWLWRKGVPA